MSKSASGHRYLGSMCICAFATTVSVVPSAIQPCKAEGLIGYLDTRGNIVIAPNFVKAGRFCEGKAAVCARNGRYGVIDTRGCYVIPPRYGQIGEFSEGLAPACEQTGNHGFIDVRGSYVVTPRFELARSFQGGLAAVSVMLDGQKPKWGFVDKTGQWVMRPQYENTLGFSEGFAAVKYGGAWHYIDRRGNRVTRDSYEVTCYGFSCGRAPVCKGGLWGYIDTAGVLTIPLNFSSITPFCDGAAIVSSGHDTRTFIIDTHGRELNGRLLPSMNHFSEGVALLWASNARHREGVNVRGVTVIPHERLKDMQFASCFHEGLAQVVIHGKCGFIDTRGNLAIAPMFAEVEDFSNGLARFATERYTLYDRPPLARPE